MSAAMNVIVILPSWLGAADRESLIAMATRLPVSRVDALAFTGDASPGTVAARAVSEMDTIASSASLVLLPAGPDGEQCAALVAARMQGASFGRCTSVEVADGAVHARRGAFGGRAELLLRSDSRITCATLRPQACDRGAAAVHAVEIAIEDPPRTAEPVASNSALPRVDGAQVVVSGGRGMAGAEGFDLLARIASALGAGLGGSLPAVDAGWVPVAHQVGQSGKFVTPKVYFAVGISGTPQHLAGISPQARIVALNSDRDAPIFQRCDVAVEGDWREILPLLAHRLETDAQG
jgi:electron transfer flavoprotein alpha subunit